jgi:hypothetical protein
MIELKVTFDPSKKENQFNISGPLEDKMTCYALLEMAKDMIRDFHMKGNRLAIPNMGVSPEVLAEIKKKAGQ